MVMGVVGAVGHRGMEDIAHLSLGHGWETPDLTPGATVICQLQSINILTIDECFGKKMIKL